MAGYKQRNDSAIARHASLVGLVMSWFAGFTALFLGGICLFIEIRDGVAVHLKINNTWREILPLLLNILGMVRTCPSSIFLMLALTHGRSNSSQR